MGTETIDRAISADSPPRIRVLKPEDDLVALFIQASAIGFASSLARNCSERERLKLTRRLTQWLTKLLRGGTLLVGAKEISPRLVLINDAGAVAVPRELLDGSGNLPLDNDASLIHRLSWALQRGAAEAVNPNKSGPMPYWADICHAAGEAVTGALDIAEIRLDNEPESWAFVLCGSRKGPRLIVEDFGIAHHEFAGAPAKEHVGRLLLARPKPRERDILGNIAAHLVRSKRRPWANSFPRYFSQRVALRFVARDDHAALMINVLADTVEYNLTEVLNMAGVDASRRTRAKRRWVAAVKRAFDDPCCESKGQRYRALLAFVSEDGTIALPARCFGRDGGARSSEANLSKTMIAAAERRLAELSTGVLEQAGIPRGQALRISAWTLYEMLSRMDNGSYESKPEGRFGVLLCMEGEDGLLVIPRSDRQISLHLFAAMSEIVPSTRGRNARPAAQILS